MTESTEAQTFLDARKALDAREAVLVAELAAIHAAQGKAPRGRKPKRASRKALGAGITPRKPRAKSPTITDASATG
jgi:hypothetical protein